MHVRSNCHFLYICTRCSCLAQVNCNIAGLWYYISSTSMINKPVHNSMIMGGIIIHVLSTLF